MTARVAPSAVSREHLQDFLDQRMRDGVIRRVIGKWLNAGIMEDEVVSYATEGTPQGGVISPLLSNLYLHQVLDRWFEQTVRPRLHGRAFLIRYADDAVLGFEEEADAQRVLAALPKRFGRYALTLHLQKTRIVEFLSPARRPRRVDPGSHPVRHFDLLGFTHFWARSRKERWNVKRKTAKKRFGRAVKRLAQWCREHRHLPVADQHRVLTQKLRGHHGYYGVTGNARALKRFLHMAERLWRKWLDRRNHRAHMDWPRFQQLLARYPLPPPRVVHSVYPRTAKP